MSSILLIDDEKLPMDYYIRALKLSNLEVKQFFDPESVVKFIKQKKPHPKAIILDIMMLPGNMYNQEETNNGLRTGILLYKDLRVHYPNIPIVFLTNVSSPDIPRLPNETEETLVVAQKIDYPPFELVELIKKMIASSSAKEKVMGNER